MSVTDFKRTISLSLGERISVEFPKFCASTLGLWVGLSVAAMWMFSWSLKGPIHDFLDQSVGMLSFLTIFIFQRAQSKDLKAIHLKLDELLASSESASNRLIKAEEAPEEVLNQVHEIYKEVAKAALDEDPRTQLVDLAHAEFLMEELHNDIEKRRV
jgi:low affinity Fe/Cu permease